MDSIKYGGGVIIVINILTQILLLVLLLSSYKPVVEADDDKTIVRKICTQTLEPDACLNCVLADTGRGTSNVSDMTYSVLFCMYSQAIYAHQCADHLFKDTAAVKLKKAFEVCKDSLFSASNTLWDGLTKMEVWDYKNANVCARIAKSDLFRCVFAFRKYANVPIPGELLNYMVQAKRLFDVAQYLFLIID